MRRARGLNGTLISVPETVSQNTTILVTEQVAALGLRIADYGYVMRQGETVLEGDKASLLALQNSQKLAEAYL